MPCLGLVECPRLQYLMMLIESFSQISPYMYTISYQGGGGVEASAYSSTNNAFVQPFFSKS